jgi:hypothetical protein
MPKKKHKQTIPFEECRYPVQVTEYICKEHSPKCPNFIRDLLSRELKCKYHHFPICDFPSEESLKQAPISLKDERKRKTTDSSADYESNVPLQHA